MLCFQLENFPIGLFFADLWGWKAAFISIVVMSIPVGFLILWKLEPIREHLKIISDRNAFHRLLRTLANPKYLLAFVATSLLGIGGYMLMPLGGVYIVNNLGVSITKLPIVYSVAGLYAILFSPLIGEFSDQYGKIKIFTFGTIVSIIIMIFTNLETTPLMVVVLANTIIFIGILSRMIPAQALISAVPEQNERGSFMAINSSAQQIAGGVGAATTGMIVTQNAHGLLEKYDRVGYVVVGIIIMSFAVMLVINKMVAEKKSSA